MRLPTVLSTLAAAALNAASTAQRPLTPTASAVTAAAWSSNGLSGPGGEHLLERARAARFVLFGEQHHVDGIAEFVAATYRQLAEERRWTLVLEAGDWTGTEFVHRGCDAMLAEAPFALAFDADGDIELVRAAEQQARRANPESDWEYLVGVDQEITAVPALEALSHTAPTWQSRRVARGLFLKAALAGGEYLRRDHSEDLRHLREAIGTSGSAALRIVDAIEQSMSIYIAHRAGERSTAASVRERRMARLLDEFLERSARDGFNTPHLLFKMGGAHTMRGVGPNGIETLGEHVARLAKASGVEALHIGIRAWSEDSELQLPEPMRTAPAAVVDCDAVTAAWTEDEAIQCPNSLRRDLEQFDLLVYLPDADRAPKTIARRAEAAYRRGVIWRIAAIAPALVVQIATLFFALGALVTRIVQATRGATPNALGSSSLLAGPWMFLQVVWLGLTGVIAIQILGLVRSPGGPTPSTALIAFDWVTPIAVATACALTVRSMLRQRRSIMVVALQALSIVAFVMTYAYLHWWNLGGMLGAR